MKKHKIITIILSLALCFFIIWFVSLAKCEILTQLHGKEFSDVYKEDTMLSDMDYWKVLEYSQTHARVYYVGLNHSCADILTFEKENSQWKQKEWDTVWSKTGSASEVVWPYWWHFIYGGF